MTLLAPLAFALGVVAAGVIVALHLLTTRRPPPQPLPTARFVPLAEARAVARTRRPTDLLLLALRIAALLLIATAFARPVPDAPGPRVRSIVALDLSSAIASPTEVVARAREALADGSALIVFDSVARAVPLDSLDALVLSEGPRAPVANLSPAFVAARDVARIVARGADSLRLVVVSAFLESGRDAATGAWRDAWPGRVELVRVERAAAGDSARLVWPDSAGDARPDAVHIAGAGGVTLVAPLARHPVPEGRVVARWRDGSPAATETSDADGCVRHVGVGVPSAGDLVLRPPYARFVAALRAPCGGAGATAIPDSVLTALSGEGPLAPARALADAAGGESPLAALLLALALLALGAEWWLRREVRE